MKTFLLRKILLWNLLPVRSEHLCGYKMLRLVKRWAKHNQGRQPWLINHPIAKRLSGSETHNGITECVVVSCLGLNHLFHETQTTSSVWDNYCSCYLPATAVCNKLHKHIKVLLTASEPNLERDSISSMVTIRTSEKMKKKPEQDWQFAGRPKALSTHLPPPPRRQELKCRPGLIGKATSESSRMFC